MMFFRNSTLKIIWFWLILLVFAGIIFEPGFSPEAKITPAPSLKTALPLLPPIFGFQVVIATAYSPPLFREGELTASGKPLEKGVIAVDKKFIPLGSSVYIPDYFPGEKFLALDTGRRIKGGAIDIWMPSKKRAKEWGRRRVKIKIMPTRS